MSPDTPKRDTEEKPVDYAEAGIPEYWIVNPINETITVLTLAGEDYVTHCIVGRGEQVTSALLPSITLDVDAVLEG